MPVLPALREAAIVAWASSRGMSRVMDEHVNHLVDGHQRR